LFADRASDSENRHRYETLAGERMMLHCNHGQLVLQSLVPAISLRRAFGVVTEAIVQSSCSQQQQQHHRLAECEANSFAQILARIPQRLVSATDDASLMSAGFVPAICFLKNYYYYYYYYYYY
jgi:hypothetical protein